MSGSSTVRLVKFHTTICRKSPKWSTVCAAVTASEVLCIGVGVGPEEHPPQLAGRPPSEHTGQESRQESKVGVC